MSEKSSESTQEELAPQNDNAGLSSDKLNLVIAICAILISAASFYATYLQADAAERQVKAMTLPLIQFGSGNWDKELKVPKISLNLTNAGVGPAIIKSVSFKYHGKSFDDFKDFYHACCEPETTKYFEYVSQDKMKVTPTEEGVYITSNMKNRILAGQDTINFIQLGLSEKSNAFWQKLNIARRDLSLKVCYCSLLDECYITEKSGIVEAINSCPIK
ncbi:hypothetical protein AADZ91_05475 [Colwelliaceae bacterium 6441]